VNERVKKVIAKLEAVNLIYDFVTNIRCACEFVFESNFYICSHSHQDEDKDWVMK